MYCALQTLRQLEKKKGKKSLFAGCEIVDWPAFRIRGFMQDVGRSYISVEELKLYVKPEDNACYYVANGNVAGKVDLY